MLEVKTLIESIKEVENHHLTIAYTKELPYYKHFLECAETMQKVMTNRQYETWLLHKMQLNGTAFNEKQFIQHAVEASAIRFFAELFPNDIIIDAKVNPENEKDVDFSFTSNGFTYDVEVKCSSYNIIDKSDIQDGLTLKFAGRFDNPQGIYLGLQKLLSATSNNPLSIEKRMDNTLKDFLQSADKKFNQDAKDEVVNILVIGCNDEDDMQNWWNYLYSTQGLFTKDSFVDINTYKNVDLVILTNLYYVHNKYQDEKISSNWSIDKTLNLILSNPFCKKEKLEAKQYLLKIFPNNNADFNNHVKRLYERNEPFLHILNYVRLYLMKEKKIFHF